MAILFLDFETALDQKAKYSLRNLPTATYLTDPRFQVHCAYTRYVGKGIDMTPAVIHRRYLRDYFAALNWDDLMLVAQNAKFDGGILAWHYGYTPKWYLDTVSLSRWVLGDNLPRHSLDAIAKYLGYAGKASGLMMVDGVWDLEEDDPRYGHLREYCYQDGRLLETLTYALMPRFPPTQLYYIDWAVRCFIEPRFCVDRALLIEYNEELLAARAAKLAAHKVSIEMLRSDTTFAALLASFGVIPARKNTAAALKKARLTGEPPKETYAFSKTDIFMQELLQSDDDVLVDLVELRLDSKSTLKYTRPGRIAHAAKWDGKAWRLPMPIEFAGAKQTNRYSGSDKLNLQNMPNTDPRTKKAHPIRRALMAGPGESVIVADASNIESRMLMAFVGEQTFLEVFRQADAGTGPDVYCYFGGQYIYGRTITEADIVERKIAKAAVLGLGYFMGWRGFQTYCKTIAGIILTDEEAQRIHAAWGRATPRLQGYKRLLKWAMAAMTDAGIEQQDIYLDPGRLVRIGYRCLRLPDGFEIKYPGLAASPGQYGPVYRYTRAGKWTTLWHGLLIENIIQALSAIYLRHAGRSLHKTYGYRPVFTVHDELVLVERETCAAVVLDAAITVLRQAPVWLPHIPLNAKGGFGKRYGDIKA